MAIARALANDPAVILADEPTANLDSKIGHEIARLLRRAADEEGRSVIVVSHDARLRDIADRVLWLEDGEFLCSPGCREEFAGDGGSSRSARGPRRGPAATDRGADRRHPSDV